ncbi:hypothetical protein [Paenibacillus sacheonensis]|uniref:Uncharacterized protein n=1 Tax=Paenibacillus sacheonensis TaxID=742054 RepID=A0A7X4YP22_9BACL|nr:hypothetical protein [Paenibacillus sacheonensis]MBM7567368.1 hypothetical protein [Paenibacillus sacheonensis]NBC69850.1 hypothetical protein [Paenibacillus sacheonensis]
MAVARVKPQLGARSTGKVIKRAVPRTLVKQTGPIFSRLTVVWVANNGVPFDTAGFFARLIRNNRVVATASFDRFGVVRFNNIRTLTNVSYTIQAFNANGVLFRSRFIPAGVETFAIIG